jgi:hypothetical protein
MISENILRWALTSGKFLSPDSKSSKAEILMGEKLFIEMNFALAIENIGDKCRKYGADTFDSCSNNNTAEILLKVSTADSITKISYSTDHDRCAWVRGGGG